MKSKSPGPKTPNPTCLINDLYVFLESGIKIKYLKMPAETDKIVSTNSGNQSSMLDAFLAGAGTTALALAIILVLLIAITRIGFIQRKRRLNDILYS